tara:strand:- start:180 stop:1493 length:1314 start_codon:yes stop_codon:yes gene_type:complete
MNTIELKAQVDIMEAGIASSKKRLAHERKIESDSQVLSEEQLSGLTAHQRKMYQILQTGSYMKNGVLLEANEVEKGYAENTKIFTDKQLETRANAAERIKGILKLIEKAEKEHAAAVVAYNEAKDKGPIGPKASKEVQAYIDKLTAADDALKTVSKTIKMAGEGGDEDVFLSIKTQEKMLKIAEDLGVTYEDLIDKDPHHAHLNSIVKLLVEMEKLTVKQQSQLETTEAIQSGITQIYNQYAAIRMQTIEKEYNKEIAAVKNTAEYKLAAHRGNQGKMDQLEKTANDKMIAAKTKEFNYNKALAVGNVTIDFLQAIAKEYGKQGIWASITAHPWLLGASAAQIATIIAQPVPTFAEGGMIGGRLHSQGGTMIEAEQGEFIMNRDAVQTIGEENLNRMNQSGSQSVNVTFTGNVLSQDFVEGDVMPQIKDAIRRGHSF